MSRMIQISRKFSCTPSRFGEPAHKFKRRREENFTPSQDKHSSWYQQGVKKVGNEMGDNTKFKAICRLWAVSLYNVSMWQLHHPLQKHVWISILLSCCETRNYRWDIEKILDGVVEVVEGECDVKARVKLLVYMSILWWICMKVMRFIGVTRKNITKRFR